MKTFFFGIKLPHTSRLKLKIDKTISFIKIFTLRLVCECVWMNEAFHCMISIYVILIYKRDRNRSANILISAESQLTINIYTSGLLSPHQVFNFAKPIIHNLIDIRNLLDWKIGKWCRRFIVCFSTNGRTYISQTVLANSRIDTLVYVMPL